MALYSSYSQTTQNLRNQLDKSYGKTMAGTYLVGSQAAGIAGQLGALESQRNVDPWSFYRGSAADALAQQSQNDPSNIYRDRLNQMMMGSFAPDDPSYEWRFGEGQRASERSLAARGLLNSGNAATELTAYGQGMASQEYQAQFSRLLQAMAGVEDQYNSQQKRLMELAGVGNVGANLQQQQVNNEAAAQNNYQLGLMQAIQQNQRNPLAGYSFG